MSGINIEINAGGNGESVIKATAKAQRELNAEFDRFNSLRRESQAGFNQSLATNPSNFIYDIIHGEKAKTPYINPRFEAMQELSRRGSSQDIINAQAQSAMEDIKMHSIMGGVNGPFAPASFMNNLRQNQLRDEAFSDLARRGSSQAMIDLQAQIAQSDFDRNTKGGGFGGLVPPRVRTLLGGIGGEDGGLQSKLLPVLGALAAFRAALWAVEPIIRGFRFAIQHLMDSINQGAKLYTDAARLGLSPARTGSLQFAANSLGISTEEAQTLLLQGEFPRTRRGGGSVTRNSSLSSSGSAISADGSIFGANARAGQIGQLQRINNLQKEFNYLLDQSKSDWNQIGDNSKTLWYTMQQIKLAALDWQVVFSNIAVAFSPIVEAAAGLSRILAKLANLSLSGIPGLNQLAQLARFIHGPTEFKQQPELGGNPLNQNINQFQRMGFLMNGGFAASNDSAKRTAKATETTAMLMKTLIERLGGVGAEVGYGFATNLP